MRTSIAGQLLTLSTGVSATWSFGHRASRHQYHHFHHHHQGLSSVSAPISASAASAAAVPSPLPSAQDDGSVIILTKTAEATTDVTDVVTVTAGPNDLPTISASQYAPAPTSVEASSEAAAAPSSSSQVAAAPQSSASSVAAPPPSSQAAAPPSSSQIAAPSPTSEAAAPSYSSQAAAPPTSSQAAVASPSTSEAAAPSSSSQAAPLPTTSEVAAPSSSTQASSTAQSTSAAAPAPTGGVSSTSPVAASTYLDNAHSAITRLQKFYGAAPGEWSSNGWWNDAQCLTLLADLRLKDSSTFLTSITDGDSGVFGTTLAGQHRENGAVTYDNWYDDELWWVIALVKTFDATQDEQYLDAANASFAIVAAGGLGAPCGGLYNGNTYLANRGQSTITTELYVESAAMLANRYSDPTQKSYFLNQALTQWSWISDNLLIDNLIQGDSLADYPSCTNDHAVLTYMEGTAISGLVALSSATGNDTYMTLASDIATASMADTGIQDNGIVFEFCDADLSCDPDLAQFKGVFMRGLATLYLADPTAAGGKIPAFLQANADSIWKNDQGSDGLLGMRYAGPFAQPDGAALQLATHSAATAALVYAALAS